MSSNVIFGYYVDSARFRTFNGKFTVADVDPQLLTHISYAFLRLNENGKLIGPDDPEALYQLVKLKGKNPNLKVLVSLGGWKEASTTFSEVAGSSTKRSTLVHSVVHIVEKYDLDGFDLDWQYPCERGGDPRDKVTFVTLVKELKHALKDKLLTAAIPASPWRVDVSYDVPEISKYLDMINVMTYHFHTYHSGHVGHNAPLYVSEVDISRGNSSLCVESGIEHLRFKGVDLKKVNLGLPAFGRTFTLRKHGLHESYAPITGPGDPGTYTSNPGTLGYNEIVQFCENWTYHWDDKQKVPYKISGLQLVGYDDPESIKHKVQYAKNAGLGGVFLWSLDTDDFHNGFPLLKAAHEVYAPKDH